MTLADYLLAIFAIAFLLIIYALRKIRGVSEQKASEIERKAYGKRNDLKGGEK